MRQAVDVEKYVDERAEIFGKIVFVLLSSNGTKSGDELTSKLFGATGAGSKIGIFEACLVAIDQQKNILIL